MTTPAMLRRRYRTDAVSTASPARLVVMLYDRLATDLYSAQAAVGGADIEGAHVALLHAQEIVAELSGSLDLELWPQGEGLAALYDFLRDRLVRANVTKDAAFVAECIEVVEPLREAFSEAALVPDTA